MEELLLWKDISYTNEIFLARVQIVLDFKRRVTIVLVNSKHLTRRLLQVLWVDGRHGVALEQLLMQGPDSLLILTLACDTFFNYKLREWIELGAELTHNA